MHLPLAFLFADDENLLIAARRGSPLAVGVGAESASIGSDVLALASMAQKIAYLEEGDLAVLRRGEIGLLWSRRKTRCP